MGKAAYPTAADLESYLLGAGIMTDTLDCAVAAIAGRRDVEHACGRGFLAGEPTVRAYDPPRRTVLEIDDLAALTAITYVPYGGIPEELVEGMDYWPEPVNAMGDGAPYELVRFRRGWPQPLMDADRRSVRIEGAWGYGTAVPEEVWLAMVHAGALRLLPEIQQMVTEGVTVITQGGATLHYDKEGLPALRTAWERSVRGAVSQYAKVRF